MSPEFTQRQAAAWPEAIAEAQRYVPSSTITTDPNLPWWLLSWADETRPGRGHRFSALWCDGEYLVQIRMDVYGYPSVSVAETTWLHSSDDDECECASCKRARDDEAHPEMERR